MAPFQFGYLEAMIVLPQHLTGRQIFGLLMEKGRTNIIKFPKTNVAVTFLGAPIKQDVFYPFFTVKITATGQNPVCEAAMDFYKAITDP